MLPTVTIIGGDIHRLAADFWKAQQNRIIDTITPEECTNYFAAAGYDAE